MKIGIIVAMEKELEQVKGLISELQTHPNHNPELVVIQSGIGKVAAALGAQRLILDHQVDCVISTGVAAGATLSVPRLHVVASTETMYHDAYCGPDCAYGQLQGQPARFKSDEQLVALAQQIPDVHTGLIVTGDWFVDSKTKARAILDQCPDALAIDMESCAIAQTCHAHKVPFISFRVISDIPLADECAQQYFDFWDQVASHSFATLKAFLTALSR